MRIKTKCGAPGRQRIEKYFFSSPYPITLPSFLANLLFVIFLFSLLISCQSSIEKKKETLITNRLRRGKSEITPQRLLPDYLRGKLKSEKRKQAIYLYKEFLKNNPGLKEELRVEIKLKIAELYLLEEEERYEKAFKRYEEEIKKESLSGTSLGLLKPPDYNFRRSIEIYRSLPGEFPDYKHLDFVYYSLGYCYYQEGQKELAKDTFKKLISLFPKSEFAREAKIITAEYYFTTNRLEEAALIYEELLKESRGEQSGYLKFIIFKLGWIYYSRGELNEALNTFVSIPTGNKFFFQRGIIDESLRIIAHIFKGTSGTKGLLEYSENRISPQFLPRLLRYLGDLYKEDKSYPDAFEAYEIFLEKYPEHPERPFVENGLIEITEATRGFKASQGQRKRFIKKYNPKSNWYNLPEKEEFKKEIYPLVKNSEAKLALELKDIPKLAQLIQEKDKISLTQVKINKLHSLYAQNLSLIFSKQGGKESLLKQLAGKLPAKTLAFVLKTLGDFYRKNKEIGKAIGTYEEFLKRYGEEEEAVYVQKLIINLYEKEKRLPEAISARKTFIKRFAPNTPWYEKNILPGQNEDRILSLREKYIRSVALYYHSLARRNKRQAADYYAEAIDYYQKYLQFYPAGPYQEEITFFLAEAFYESGDKNNALNYYRRLSVSEGSKIKQRKPSKYKVDAAYALILVYEELRKEEEHFGQYTEGLIQSINEFTQNYPGDKRTPELLFKAGEVSFKRGKYRLSRSFLERLINNFLQHPLSLSAAKIIARSYLQEEKFEEAQKWYGLALEFSPEEKKKEVDPLKEMMTISIFKKAEKSQAKGKYLAAGNEFLQASQIVKDNRLRQIALFNAGINFKKEGRCDFLFIANTKLLKEYPGSKFSKGALDSYRECIEKKKEYKAAANNLIEFSLANPNLVNLAPILINAAEYYEKAGLSERTIETYRLFNKHFPTHPHNIKVNLKRGLIEFKENRLGEAKRFFEKAILSYEKIAAKDNPEMKSSAARAKFMLAELLFESFKKIRIREPLERSLEKKKKMLGRVLLEYSEAAKFNIQEWTTASTYRIGLVFEDFRNALLEAEKPADLTKEEREDYQMLLEEQAYPFEEKAREAYLVNLKRLYSQQVFNKWIEATLERMAFLVPWAYKRKEEIVWEKDLLLFLPEIE